MHRSTGARRAFSALVANGSGSARPNMPGNLSPAHKPYKQVRMNSTHHITANSITRFSLTIFTVPFFCIIVSLCTITVSRSLDGQSSLFSLDERLISALARKRPNNVT